MSLRRISLVALCLAALTCAAAARAAGEIRLTEVKRVTFPDRAFVLSLPKETELTPGQVRLQENGEPVDNFSVVPATLAGSHTFGVVLVLDASNSMGGAPIADAVAAARAFAAHATASETLGLISFNRGVRVLVKPTTDEGAISAALRKTPSLAEGTSLYDAAAKAVDVLSAGKIAAGSIVLLTDGADTRSGATPETVLAKARAAGVRIFGVGLHSPQFEPAPLSRLAASTGATYVEAESPASLKGIYSSLSEQLASEYLLRYRSLAGPATAVRVTVELAGQRGISRLTYRTPSLAATRSGPYQRPLIDRLVSSPASMLAISLLAALLIGMAVSTPLRRRRTELRRRIGAFVAPAGPREEGSAPPRPALSVQAFARAERVLERMGWWERFSKDVEVAEFPLAPVALALMTTAGTLLLAILLGALAPVAALFALAVPLVVRLLVSRRLRAKREKFGEQLPDNLLVLAASLRAGHSFPTALSAVVEQAEEPSRSELRRAVSDEQLGVPIEEALLRVSQRMANADLEQVALVAALQRETGGNTAEVLDTVSQTVRERTELHRLIRTLTAEGRLSQWILTGLPVGVALIVSALNPSYLSPLFTETAGQAMLALAVVLFTIGFLLIRRILDIEL